MCPCRKEKYRRTNKPKDRYKPKENKCRDGPLLPLIQGGFAELNAVSRYQGDNKSSEESVFNSAHGVYVLVWWLVNRAG